MTALSLLPEELATAGTNGNGDGNGDGNVVGAVHSAFRIPHPAFRTGRKPLDFPRYRR
jgi:hypothetical protein